MRRALALLMIGSLFFTCGSKLKKLEPEERDHFNALKVWMDKGEQKTYLKLKTQDERDAWLQNNGAPTKYWERFYKYEQEERQLMIDGEIIVGFDQDQVFMTWGKPFDRRRLTDRPAARSELFIYRFEVDKKGYVYVWEPKSNETYKAVDTYQVEVYVDDAVVTEFKRKESWQ